MDRHRDSFSHCRRNSHFRGKWSRKDTRANSGEFQLSPQPPFTWVRQCGHGANNCRQARNCKYSHSPPIAWVVTSVLQAFGQESLNHPPYTPSQLPQNQTPATAARTDDAWKAWAPIRSNPPDAGGHTQWNPNLQTNITLSTSPDHPPRHSLRHTWGLGPSAPHGTS